MKNHRIIRKVKFILAAAAFVLVFSLIVMLLWNWLIPDIFKGPSISYLQSIGLIILSQILLRGFGRGFRHSHRERYAYWRKRFEEKLDKMTPEEREEYMKRCRGPWYHESWKKEDDKSTSSAGTA